MRTRSHPHPTPAPQSVPSTRVAGGATIQQQQLDTLDGQILYQSTLCKHDLRDPDTPLWFVQISPRGWTCVCASAESL